MTRMRFAATVIVAGLMASPVMAMDGPPGDGWHHGDMDMLHGVNLTDSQKAQIHQIMKSDESAMRLTGKQMMELHEQLSSALLSGATMAQLSPILKQEEALRTEMDTQRLQTALKMRALLSAQQLAQAAALHAKLASLHAQEHELVGAPGPVPQ